MAEMHFVSPNSIERLESGEFQPTRVARRERRRSSMLMDDRRDTISPLAVAKRSIRYEPKTFLDRKEQVLSLAKTLNSEDSKILMISGKQGIGKTSLLRAIIEMMDGNNQQVLWYSANRHTDFEEISGFLIQYIHYVGQAYQRINAFKQTGDVIVQTVEDLELSSSPFERLKQVLNKISHLPLLIVIDNVEFLVDSQYRFKSTPFKDILNYILSFSNVKLILAGHRLPYTDMSREKIPMKEIVLYGLTEDKTRYWLSKMQEEALFTDEVLKKLYTATQGSPWLIKLLVFLEKNSVSRSGPSASSIDSIIETIETATAEESEQWLALVMRKINKILPLEQRLLLNTMSFLRHPTRLSTLEAMARYCHPEHHGLNFTEGARKLDKSIIRPFFKVLYPPQEVLVHVKRQLEANDEESKFLPWFELYEETRRVIYDAVSPVETTRMHASLQSFYMEEKERLQEERLSMLKNSSLLAEAKFHSRLSKQSLGQTSGFGKSDLMGSRNLYESPSATADPSSRANEQVFEQESDALMVDDLNLTEEEIEALKILEEGQKQSQTLPVKTNDNDEPIESLFEEDSFDEETEDSEFEMSGELADYFDQTLREPVTEAPPESEKTDVLDELTEESSQALKSVNHEQWLQQEILKAHRSHDHVRLFSLMIQLAEFRINQGRLDGATQCLDKSLQHLENNGLSATDVAVSDMGKLYYLKALVSKKQHLYSSALSLLEKAQDVMLHADSPVLSNVRASVLQLMGDIYYYQGNMSAAIDTLSKAVGLYKQLNASEAVQDKSRLADHSEALFLLGQCFEEIADFDQAIGMYKQSLAIETKMGDTKTAAATLSSIAGIYALREDYDEAVKTYIMAIQYDQDSGYVEGQIGGLEAVSHIFLKRGDAERALNALKQALSLAIPEGFSIWQANLYKQCGDVHKQQGRNEEAKTCYQRAISVAGDRLARESVAYLEKQIEGL